MCRLYSVISAAVSLLFACGAGACTPDLPGPGETVVGERYVIKYRTVPATIIVGEHFAVELAVCAKDGAPAPVSVRVDAVMPEHRHGMNYKADVKVMASGRHRAEGLLFHMPGRWEFLFDVQADGKPHRLVNSMVLR